MKKSPKTAIALDHSMTFSFWDFSFWDRKSLREDLRSEWGHSQRAQDSNVGPRQLFWASGQPSPSPPFSLRFLIAKEGCWSGDIRYSVCPSYWMQSPSGEEHMEVIQVPKTQSVEENGLNKSVYPRYRRVGHCSRWWECWCGQPVLRWLAEGRLACRV